MYLDTRLVDVVTVASKVDDGVVRVVPQPGKQSSVVGTLEIVSGVVAENQEVLGS